MKEVQVPGNFVSHWQKDEAFKETYMDVLIFLNYEERRKLTQEDRFSRIISNESRKTENEIDIPGFN